MVFIADRIGEVGYSGKTDEVRHKKHFKCEDVQCKIGEAWRERSEEAAASERARWEKEMGDGGMEGGGTNVSFIGWGRTEMAQHGAKLTPLQEQRTGKHQWHHPPIQDRQLELSEGMMGAAKQRGTATAEV